MQNKNNQNDIAHLMDVETDMKVDVNIFIHGILH